MGNTQSLVLEIFRQDSSLKMSICPQGELSGTLRHYSECSIKLPEIEKLCQEAVFILNKTRLKNASGEALLKNLSHVGQLLWDQLLTKPVKDLLRQKEARDLTLSIDEELVSIPWELCYDGSEFLCLRFNMGRLVRTNEPPAQAQYRSLNGALKMLVLVNPTGDLESAYLEGTHIRNQFDRLRSHVHIDFKSSSIDTLYVKKNLREYDLVHFAGHCEYDPDDPQGTGWNLSDGRLTTSDILAMGSTVSLPSLLFSNACHSASVHEESLASDYQEKNYSLAAAFLFSGVRHYIGAIRKIEDPVSLVFAEEFYGQLIAGKSVGESIRLSRLRLTREYGLESLHWTSYLLYGDPNFSLWRSPEKELSTRPKIRIKLSKRQILFLAAGFGLIGLGAYFATWLPTINPSTYWLFLKSQEKFRSGNNQEVIALAKRINSRDQLFLPAYSLLADTYLREGNRQASLDNYFQYARLCEKRGDSSGLADAYLKIGWCYHLSAEYPKAYEFYQKALALATEKNDSLHEAVALRKMAVWFIDRRVYDRALELLTKSSEINRQRQHLREFGYNLACDYFDFGLLFADKEDYEAAKEFYQKSKRLFEKFKVPQELSDYYFNLGEICLFEKQYQGALEYYLKGLRIDERCHNKTNLASDYTMLGELYLEMDNPTQAEQYFLAAAECARQAQLNGDLASSYYNLGLLYAKQGKKNRAKEYLRNAQEIYATVDRELYDEIKHTFAKLDGM